MTTASVLSRYEAADVTHVWRWRQKFPREGMGDRYGQPCRVLVRSRRMNSALVEFVDGYRVVTSRNAVRKVRS